MSLRYRGKHCIPSSVLGEVCHTSYILDFHNPIPWGPKGKHEGLPVQILTKPLQAVHSQSCRHGRVSITRSHLLLDFTVEGLWSGPQSLVFWPGCAGGSTTGLLDGNCQQRALTTHLTLTPATRERSFEGVPFCHISIWTSVSLDFAFGRGQFFFSRKHLLIPLWLEHE